jgi:hypothetical protein
MKLSCALSGLVAATALATASQASATVLFNGAWLSAGAYQVNSTSNYLLSQSAYTSGELTAVGGEHTFANTKATVTLVKVGKKTVPVVTTTQIDHGTLQSTTYAEVASPEAGSYGFDQAVELYNVLTTNSSSAYAWGAFQYDFYSDTSFDFTISYDATGARTASGPHASASTPSLYTYLYGYMPSYSYHSFAVGAGDAGSITYSGLHSGWYQLVTYDATDPYVAINSGAGHALNRLVADYQFEISAAPEPSTWAVMLGGLFLLGWQLRSRRQGAATA